MIKKYTCNVFYLVLGILVLTATTGQSQTCRVADEHINRGNALYDKGDLDGAIVEYDRAIALNPKQAYYYFNRGNARKDRGDFDEAISDYEKALSLDLKVPEVCNNRGAARLGKEDLDGAISDFSKALSLKPDHANAYNNRGHARQQKGDVDGALGDYEKAISINSKSATISTVNCSPDMRRKWMRLNTDVRYRDNSRAQPNNGKDADAPPRSL